MMIAVIGLGRLGMDTAAVSAAIPLNYEQVAP
jgi:UDP-N-acetyl-D-mannosaminuronate dehydrogenase